MCGIAGILKFDGTKADPRQLRRMTDILRHRGPDGEGHWLSEDGTVALGHRRLAVIDLTPAAAQPMVYEDRFVITLNGEIYNYTELREVLLKKGCRFQTQSDTEVLLAMYMEFGEECLQYLDGMFAFCLYDKLKRSCFCARDRFGEKPFYFFHAPGREFIFASEVKGLIPAGVSLRENMKMVYYFIAYQVVENPFDKQETFFGEVRSLPPGHLLHLDPAGRLMVRSYWSLPVMVPEPPPSPEEAAERIRELFRLSVSRRLRADVPVGSSLSGGIDSSAVVSTVHELNRQGGPVPQLTFTARFDDPAKDEGRYVELLTEGLAVDRHEVWVTARNFHRDLETIIWHQEEPMGGASPVAQWEVMKLAADRNVTVLLDGQGADEIFAGYPHYFRPYLKECLIRGRTSFRKERDAFRVMQQEPLPTGLPFVLETVLPSLFRMAGTLQRRFLVPAYLSDLDPGFAGTFKRTPPPFQVFGSLNDTLHYAVTGYGLGKLLKLADRNAMAFGREVRMPFLFHPLAEYLFTLPASYKLHAGWSKWILRKAFEGRLPDAITWRKDKLGYEPPEAKWLSLPEVREKIRHATGELVRMKILKRPDPGKAWVYWNTYYLLKVFKEQTIKHILYE